MTPEGINLELHAILERRTKSSELQDRHRPDLAHVHLNENLGRSPIRQYAASGGVSATLLMELCARPYLILATD